MCVKCDTLEQKLDAGRICACITGVGSTFIVREGIKGRNRESALLVKRNFTQNNVVRDLLEDSAV